MVKQAACQTARMPPESLRNITLADPALAGTDGLGRALGCPQLRTIRSSFAGNLQNFRQKI
jgi:hypothetical protein